MLPKCKHLGLLLNWVRLSGTQAQKSELFLRTSSDCLEDCSVQQKREVNPQVCIVSWWKFFLKHGEIFFMQKLNTTVIKTLEPSSELLLLWSWVLLLFKGKTNLMCTDEYQNPLVSPHSTVRDGTGEWWWRTALYVHLANGLTCNFYLQWGRNLRRASPSLPIVPLHTYCDEVSHTSL